MEPFLVNGRLDNPKRIFTFLFITYITEMRLIDISDRVQRLPRPSMQERARCLFLLFAAVEKRTTAVRA